MKNFYLLKCLVFLSCCVLNAKAQSASQKQPNIIIIFADDLGYGDLGSFGHPTIRTPYLDKMAHEGMRFTQFYVGANVCTPSRAALLTGRLPIRSGMAGSDESGNVLYPHSLGGLPQSEITIAEALKTRNYQTAIIGKWHLGHLPQHLPVTQGFDYFFGIPYSNDMIPPAYKDGPLLPLYKSGKVIEEDPDQSLLTRRYTEEAISFIRKNKARPFFLYYPNNFPHTPLFASGNFKGKSKRGLYGDVVEELDWSIGQILNTLKELNIDKNTLVIFTSDNGPWLTQKERGGSAGLLFEGKGSAYEGGMRVPAIAWWPGKVKPNQVSTALATTMDFFPTIAHLAGAAVPADRTMDGTDLLPVLTGQKSEVRELVYFYTRHNLYAIRKGPWKAHFITRPSYNNKVQPETHEIPLLYNIENDPSEKYNVNEKYPQIVKDMQMEYEKHKAGVTAAPSQLDASTRKK